MSCSLLRLVSDTAALRQFNAGLPVFAIFGSMFA